jgi:glycine/D-amino acid oxidase-like deaminating enzyme
MNTHGEGADNRIFQQLIKCPQLDTLTYEQYLIADRAHPGILNASTAGEIATNARLLGESIKHPGLWLKKQLSRLELKQSAPGPRDTAVDDPTDAEARNALYCAVMAKQGEKTGNRKQKGRNDD